MRSCNAVAIGKVNLLAGPGGLGKTYLTCGIISTISKGGTFVDGDKAEIGDVIQHFVQKKQ